MNLRPPSLTPRAGFAFSPAADPAETIYIKCAKVGESWELKKKYNPDSIRRNVLALV